MAHYQGIKEMADVATWGIGSAFAALLADAAISDLRGFRIANRDPCLIIILFTITSFFRLDLREVLAHLFAGCVLFAVGAALFARGVWGGGDAKLAAAVGVWTGFAGMPRFLAAMALTGGVLALAALAARALTARPATADAPWCARVAHGGHLPYGVAIGAAGLDWMLRTFPAG
ncbi:Membrane protein [uncultured Alphaproteobacteria bacterium]|uniref:Membrane protein n=1 Tax=uncultured Alphaproteobacteria bacterium TaxID=91750 RepID=A0A212KJA4_9PROT|nr:Membrane protein [uncultured Alphaproteobacteria bacterium]